MKTQNFVLYSNVHGLKLLSKEERWWKNQLILSNGSRDIQVITVAMATGFRLVKIYIIS